MRTLWTSLWWRLVALCILGLLPSGCGGGGSDTKASQVDSRIVGTWRYASSGQVMTFTFNSGGTFSRVTTITSSYGTVRGKAEGTFSTSGSTLNFTTTKTGLDYNDDGTVSDSEMSNVSSPQANSYTWSVSGTTLTLRESNGDTVSFQKQ